MRSFLAGVVLSVCAPIAFAAVQGGTPAVPLPLFPPNNWWNQDISAAPVDTNSANYITFIGATKGLHPDFGGDAGGGDVYGFPIIRVEGTQPKKTVEFVFWPDQSDGVDHSTETSVPFYPVPPEAITTNGWVEGGQRGDVDQRDDADRHILIIDQTNNRLYELYNVWYNGTQWEAGSGAHYYMNRNDRRPDTWTSADAAGLAIAPGLVRYDEAFGSGEIRHAFRMTVRGSNGYVFPASHNAGSAAGALPMGARLRLKAGKDISSSPPEIQRIFRAFKKYGLIVADNGTDMYISGTYDVRWNNDVLNPEFGKLKASDFEVVQLGWKPSVALVPDLQPSVRLGDAVSLVLTAYDANGNIATGYRGNVQFTSSDGAATLPVPYTFTAADAGKHIFPMALIFRTQGTQHIAATDTAAATITGSRGTNVTSVLQTIATSTYWPCFWYATRSAADAHMAQRNDDATLVSTGAVDFPWVVVERWVCDLCVPDSEPLYSAVQNPPGYVPAANERVVTGVDGTVLLVRRRALTQNAGTRVGANIKP